MGLIDRLYRGVLQGEIVEPFSMSDFKEWMETYNIKKPDETSYTNHSVESLLSNSAKHNQGSSNLNRKVLNTRNNAYDKQEYWFDGERN